MLLKGFANVLILAIAGLCFAQPAMQATQRSAAPDWTGTWVIQESGNQKKNSSAVGSTTLVISQSGPELKITRKFLQAGTETVQELMYYTDERGESNPTSNGKGTLNSNTRQRGNKLIVRFLLPASTVNKNTVVNERIDEWKLSSDGKTLTQTSSFKSSSSATDASNNSYRTPREPNVFASPLRWKEKKVFKRI
jgi:hypothetical protein